MIFEEKDETFTCGISLSSDEKFFIISTSDHITTEEYFFPSKALKILNQYYSKKEKKIFRYSIDSVGKNIFISIQIRMLRIIKFLDVKSMKLIN